MKKLIVLLSYMFLLPTIAMAQGAKIPLKSMAKGDYILAPKESSIVAKVMHEGKDVEVAFNSMTGHLYFNPKYPEDSELHVNVSSKVSDMNIADIVSFAKFPKIEFYGTKFMLESAFAGKIEGDLHLMGTSKPITLDAEIIENNNNSMTFSASTSIKSNDFNLGTALPKEIKLEIQSRFEMKK